MNRQATFLCAPTLVLATHPALAAEFFVSPQGNGEGIFLHTSIVLGTC